MKFPSNVNSDGKIVSEMIDDKWFGIGISLLCLLKIEQHFNEWTSLGLQRILGITGDSTTVDTVLIIGLHPANERRRFNVTLSLIGWAQT